MFEARDITLHYGGSQILHGVNLIAEPGQVTCVMGNNGVGKTSLLKVLSGSHPRSGGTLRLNGEELGRVNAQAMAARGVGFVPQGRMIFPLLTVRENLETGFSVLPRGERRIPDEIFEHFPVLAEMSHRRGGDLSGGQQQQLAIARALTTRPRLLILDEPTEGIQPNVIKDIARVIALLARNRNMAVVLVEQYYEFARELGDQLAIMVRGEVALAGLSGSLDEEAVRRLLTI